ncbi:FAD-dependent oxidoreductase [Coraliomargarita akajimensis]|uniref:Coagulation factor 5/8 type domain protein n=1 Tax=Coraliomargarita akajimensis (strain DSM 45221 / IAM 15411 / JCM 23193 / KCTC 12865 / 04OKA010-24) TaxID=583355 RepID=D5EN99_CORAD|nr:FAD-dependent oxidoreductase [Coraliomargarita akajimensis]ADE53534.1 coagulation factor 5/8 type domain protein [Coraliomargarita akajimensis DSM 45221]
MKKTIPWFRSIALASVLMGSQALAAEDVRGLWQMDDGVDLDVTDSSGHANHGITRDGRWTAGAKKAGLQISGSWVECGNDASLDITDAISIEGWIKPWSPRFPDRPTLLAKQGAYALHLGPGKAASLTLYLDGKPVTLSSKHSDWKNGKWQHIAGTYDGSVMKLYVNGQLDNEKAVSGTIATSKAPVYIGSIKKRNAFIGTLDEVKLSASADSAEAVYASYDSGMWEIERAESRFNQYFSKAAAKRDPKAVVPGFVWIESEDFEDYGGWTMDTQFVPQMGSPYLLAPGFGYPVADATTSIELEESGTYKLWVRSRNWIPEHSPGKFVVSVNGRQGATTFGTADSAEWVWQDGGEFELSKGAVELAIKDLTGYYGRCDAILLTKDLSYTPPVELADYKAERDRLTGKDTDIEFVGDYDVIVVGGGAAGANAAIAAARTGAKTALIQDRPMLGGNNSAELGVPILGPADYGKKNAREAGLNEEIGRYRSYNFLSKWGTGAEHIAAQEENLTVFYNRHVFDAEMEGQRIQAVKAFDMITTEVTRYTATQFIDCTGDGWLGYYAGAEYRLGREAKSEFGESLAPEEADTLTMSGSIFGGSILGYKNKDTKEPYTMDGPAWLWDLSDNTEALEARKGVENTYKSGTWWHENRNNVDDLWDPEGARDGLIRVSLSYVYWVKNHSNMKDKAENFMIEVIPTNNAKRETRRLVGDHILTQDDILDAVLFEDRICYGGWGLDIHHPDGIFSKEGPFDFNEHTPWHSVPFRILYSKNIDNLLFAGRNVSCTHTALGSLRVQGTTGMMGQAVGTAAAMCVERDVDPRGLYQKYIGELQQQLLKDDQFIIDLKNQDSNDLALQAKVTASSMATQKGFGQNEVVPTGKPHALSFERAVMFASGELDTVGTVSVLLKSTNSSPTDVSLNVYGSYKFGDFKPNSHMGSATGKVPANGEHWVEFEINSDVKGKFIALYIPAVDGISWSLMETAPTGSCRAYKDAKGVWNVVQNQYYAFYLDSKITTKSAYEPSNATNGMARIVAEHTNMWKSDPTQAMPQWLQLDLGKKTAVNTIYVTFDTNLNQAKRATWEWKVTDRIVPESVKNYEVQVHNGSDWETVVKVEDNYQRRRIHEFPTVQVDKVRVLITKTNGDASARIYEVRLYNE